MSLYEEVAIKFILHTLNPDRICSQRFALSDCSCFILYCILLHCVCCKNKCTCAGVSIEMSLAKDQSLTVVVSGKTDAVLKARKLIVQNLQTQVLVKYSSAC